MQLLNDGKMREWWLLQANASKMLVNDDEMLVNDGERLVNDGDLSIWSYTNCISLTSISPSLTSILLA